MKQITVKKNEANQRLDKFLKKLLPNAGSSFLYKMLRKKNITLNKSKAAGTEILTAGDTIEIFFSDETFIKFSADQHSLAQEFEELSALPMKGLKIIYEDDDLLIADKPANMLSQKAADSDISANERLLGYLIREGGLTREEYATYHPSVCNRLDRNTTGLLIMGKTLSGTQRMSAALKNRSIGKFYHAIVIGRMNRDGELKGYLIKDEATNRVAISKTKLPDSVYIETHYKVLKYERGMTLLEIHLITGKTHQIRAHLASIGHPVAGDPKYGDREFNRRIAEKYGVNRQLLHAYRLEFDENRHIIAEEPVDFRRVMAQETP